MAQYEGSYPQSEGVSSSAGQGSISGWAIGFTFYASMMMLLLGSFHLIDGFAAVLNDEFFVVRSGYDLSVDTTTWGWIHIFSGILLIFSGLAIMTGALWARIVAILLAGLSILANFWSIPYYPVWSIVMIAMGIGVIWALTTHGRDMASDSY